MAKLLVQMTLLVLAFVHSHTAAAATEKIILDVPGMSCSVCPITVKKSLKKLPGVRDVKVSLETKQATVTFDNSRVKPEALMEATENAGYPSTVHRN